MVLSALLSISCMLLLGFADDVLDLRWRHKGRYTLVLGRVGSDRRPGRMPDREILVDSKIMVVAIIAVNGRTRSNIRPICQVEFENLVTTMVVANPGFV